MSPLPDTPVTDAPLRPKNGVTAKSLVSTPVTDSLNVTVKSTDAALVGFALARVLLSTVGGVVSGATKVCPVLQAPKVEAPSGCQVKSV